ncbi:MAG: EamA family transporter [Candidatus Rokubacteria bacterium]|nr:EamA family transporter [Candidatus Rokubacteria bacterium]
MTGAALALVIGAAIFHAAWNALAKRAHDQLAFLWSSVSLATLLLGPVWLGMLSARGLPAAALPFVIATIVLHAFYFFALGRSYRLGEFSLVYPIARGLGVALVPILALPLFDERLSPLGTAGVTLVVLGIVGLHLTPRAVSAAASESKRVGPGTGWALLTGLTIAAYSLVDKAGVARLHPVPYIGLLGLGSILLLLPTVLANPDALRREWAVNWRWILVASSMNLTAYLLVLFAFRLSKAGYVVAARELSIVFSAIIGSFWFNEGRLGPRLAGAGVVLAGVACVALAR